MTLKELTIGMGVVGGGMAALFGGWDAILNLLLVAMAIDYLTGLIVAGVFKNSTKTATGSLESRVGFKGIGRKGTILLVVILAVQFDTIIGTTVVQDGVCIAYAANEIISITENCGRMGIPVPDVLMNAIEVLKNKGDKK